ncbi:hypothetical protein [Clostridium estertheticum]|uniref:hypothetical protein n=1 Tax=Clostridium estertheticum TaxID=238834 RepID=UPI001C0B1A19|nr:hypothetical protein [Clostridium estertheticum]MBU3187214.1 hypothetical protein [Clostridium estertheticum]
MNINSSSVGNLINYKFFEDEDQIPLKDRTDDMVNFFTNDKCQRPILAMFENMNVIITGKYEKFGYNNHSDKMSVQKCYIEIDGKPYSLGHMWWQNVYNSNLLNSKLAENCFVTGTGIVRAYKSNDVNFPCDESYGINDVCIL